MEPMDSTDAPSDDGWIEWDGVGACPLDRRTRVEVRLRDGRVIHGQVSALSWRHTETEVMTHGDILSYRKLAPSDIDAAKAAEGGKNG